MCGGRLREQGTWKGNEDDHTVQQLAAVPSPAKGSEGSTPAADKGGGAFAMSDAEVSAARARVLGCQGQLRAPT